jgi:hypothetical protein
MFQSSLNIYLQIYVHNLGYLYIQIHVQKSMRYMVQL